MTNSSPTDATHLPRSDNTCASTQAILDLIAQLRAVEDPDGSWPGADVVEILLDWIHHLGLDHTLTSDPAGPDGSGGCVTGTCHTTGAQS